MTKAETIDPQKCPLCGKPNACLMAACAQNPAACWCNSPEVAFLSDLLQRLPVQVKDKACICLACAQKADGANAS